MIQLQSKIKITDNSGVLIGKTIKILKPKDGKVAIVGDLILISSQVQATHSGIKTLECVENAVVLLDAAGEVVVAIGEGADGATDGRFSVAGHGEQLLFQLVEFLGEVGGHRTWCV